MKRRLLAVLTMAVSASVTFAQTPQGPADVIKQVRVVQGGPEGAPPPPPGDFFFIASESFGGKIVKGAPYSAEAVTESIQVLGDGNRIVNRFNRSIYRDGEGRTRREQTLKGLGPLGTGNEPLQTIFINDPVAGVTYTLDSRSNTAHKSAPFKLQWTRTPGAPGADAEGQRFEFKVAPGGASGNMIMTAPLGSVPPGAGTRIAVTQTEHLSVGTAGGAAQTYVFRQKSGQNNEVKENLGKQNIEGVEAEGTRTTVTIPAGEIGNERPIEIVSERWYSPELQLVVMTRHSDPRSGETTYKLTNINRAEPAKSLFEVPAGYTIKEGPHGPAPMMPRVRKLNPEE